MTPTDSGRPKQLLKPLRERRVAVLRTGRGNSSFPPDRPSDARERSQPVRADLLAGRNHQLRTLVGLAAFLIGHSATQAARTHVQHFQHRLPVSYSVNSSETNIQTRFNGSSA